ncbi:SGNH/GDSL hydrolase family protein [Flammeovirga kamogawensis]|uniref:SGNH/GDSL hydrolase family protein n=1 Tax=Flammeovirga kamogawensis TaxID=373891 RepID=A0ABX8GTY3_9BACT|nr:SGNH/GDSL hydrolase family protein [Flammeovirga kamogawensis]MBB6459884.1 lysophospholipase L1-like esterase [Flammeovirga kamogawensis]QWG07063.1 SGNH/GDSL hydrolase family protein [Flammeovirga kamogawensis]TRX68884.1 SGNH/GDSL hydrolase family protein [Flammeovirga kamogawensis]
MKSYLIGLLSILIFGCTNQTEEYPSPSYNSTTTATVLNENIPTRSLNILALGDSYTIGASVQKKDRWNEQLKAQLESKGYSIGEVTYIAQTGWTTKNLINAIEAQKNTLLTNYDLVTLLIGVNNQYQRINFDTFLNEYPQLLTTAIKYGNNNPDNVVVLSIPDYGATYSAPSPSISTEIDKYNSSKANLTYAEGVRFFNITSISKMAKQDRTLIASDGLHPSAKMYRYWVNDIIDDVFNQLLEP